MTLYTGLWLLLSVLSVDSLVYPYNAEMKCLVRELSLDTLNGTWHVFYSSSETPLHTIEMQVKDKNSVQVVSHFLEQGDQLARKSYELTYEASVPGLLKEITKRGTFFAAYPWFVLAVKPEQYLTATIIDRQSEVYDVILTREEGKLSPQAIDGLGCLLKQRRKTHKGGLLHKFFKRIVFKSPEKKENQLAK